MQHDIKLTERQQEGYSLAKSAALFLLYRGGSRSGKTFLICFMILMRAMAAPKSRHTILRKTAVDCRRTLFDLTFKNVMNLAYPKLWDELVRKRKINDKEMSIELPNGSIILFDGLDDSTREDRILGDEYTTIYVSEVTQFLDFGIFESLMGRLNLEPEIDGMDGRVMAPKMFLDCNPTSKRHWTYKAFIEGVNPNSGEAWPRSEEFAEFHMNPEHNAENNSRRYMENLENLSAAKRKRFMAGEWADDNENALFKPEYWEGDGEYKRLAPRTPDEVRGEMQTIVAVDPAGSSKKGSDETGIIVLGIDAEGVVYVLADKSGRYSPPEWAAEAIAAYQTWHCSYIVTEDNYGKEMVPNTIRMLNRSVPVKCVSAKDGKVIRADPVATLYEQARVHHCGTFEELENQMAAFTRDWNRTKNGSPDRLDALVWGVTDLAVKEMKRYGGSQHVVAGLWS